MAARLQAQERLQALFEKDTADREAMEKQLELEREAREMSRRAIQHTRSLAAKRIQAVGRGYLSRRTARETAAKIEREIAQRALDAQLLSSSSASGNSSSEAGLTIENDDEWVEYWDENAQATYYFNVQTQEASWTRPEISPASPTSNYESSDGGYDTAGTVTDQYEDNTGAPTYHQDEYGYYDEYGQYQYYDDSMTGESYSGYADPYVIQQQQQPYVNQQQPYTAPYQQPTPVYAQQQQYYDPYGGAQPPVAAAVQYPPEQQYAQQSQSYYEDPYVAGGGYAQNTGYENQALPQEYHQEEHWEQHVDPETGAAYVYNPITGETRWT